MLPWTHGQEQMGTVQAAERCEAEADMMRHTHVRCDKPRGHAGNHHATITGQDMHLAQDGHSVRATTWQVEWRDEPAPQRAA